MYRERRQLDSKFKELSTRLEDLLKRRYVDEMALLESGKCPLERKVPEMVDVITNLCVRNIDQCGLIKCLRRRLIEVCFICPSRQHWQRI